MNLEITLLRLLRKRDKYEKLHRAVPKPALDERTRILLDDYGKFFREFDEAQEIEADSFFLWFKSFAHPKLSSESLEVYRSVIGQITEDVPSEIEAGLLDRLVATDTAHKLEQMLTSWQDGEELDLGASLRQIVEGYELETERKVKTPLVVDSIGDLLEDMQDHRGLTWRNPLLNLSMRPLQPGDFGIIAARPDKGKSSFLTDNATHWASQLPELYPDEERSIIWFNNEGPGRRIKQRCYNSALDKTTNELIELHKAGQIDAAYSEALGGNSDSIKVYDVHDFWNHEIEDIVRQVPPAVVIFDMVDNIRFGGSANNNGQRTDQLLEAMYQWARIMAVKHDTVVLATSQISAEGDNLCYPTLPMLKDSKTGKQGAADFILTIGAMDDMPNARYFGLTKNKLAIEGGPKAPKIETHFDGLRGRYRQPSEANGE